MTAKTVKNNAGEDEKVGEILIYGPIVEDGWWDDDVTPKGFVNELRALGDIDHIHVRINSYGGHVSAGFAIYSILKQHQAEVTVYIDGFALSAASLIAMAGDTIIMPGNAMMMIHNPATRIAGDARDLRREADLLDKIRESMIAVYNDQTDLSRDKLIQMLDDETWFTAEEAFLNGFVHIVEAPIAAAASIKPGIFMVNGREFDLTLYRNVPEKFKNEMEEKNLETKNIPIAGGTVPVVQQPVPPVPAPAPLQNQPTAPPVSTAPELPGSVGSLSVAEAIKADRERMKAIDALFIPGAEELIAKAKYETGATPEQVALEIVMAHKQTGITALAARHADAQDSGVGEIVATNLGAGIDNPENQEKSNALRDAIMKGRESK